ncbi:alpha/beta hydrolase family protein [Geminisphaera colitermitum]|uniref:alpha/beta hydrolase family protein n=1 Tax=Geminisphaera colitermitum TaxID=1148786 RepID=UPI000158D5D8|nr:acetylxylan esterase [Geminisphaera colitermitum]
MKSRLPGCRRNIAVVLAVFFVATGLAAPAPTWDFAALQSPPRVFDAPAAYTQSEAVAALPDGVRAFAFEGLPWQGNPTRVFAFYGAPAGASSAKPAPGIVLVHGAGGTAFANWVKLWVDRGYAAIAFDHDGGIPVGKYSHWQRNPQNPGPKRSGTNDITLPVADQWMYHAVADTLLAHSLLASFPEVDAERIGATGISYGAVVLANVIGIDTRLKFAVPVYGCGFISENEDDGSRFIDSKVPWEKAAARVTEWNRLWDPKHRLPQARLPILWLNGTNDFAFTMSAWQRSYRAAPGTQAVCLRVRMKHGHGAPGENPEEIRAFADSIVRGGVSLARVTGQGRDAATNAAWVTWTAAPDTPVREAVLNFTRTSGGRWQDRIWETMTATVDDVASRATATVPADASVFYFNLTDARGLIVSSEHVEMPPSAL